LFSEKTGNKIAENFAKATATGCNGSTLYHCK
jgi:hypothetical protein